MNIKKLLTTLSIAALIVIAIVFITGNKSNSITTQDTVTIGGLFALSGDAAAWGELEQKAAMMAIEEINEKGGIDGKVLAMISEDTHSSAKDSVTAAQKLTSIDKVDVLLGSTWLDSYSGATAMVANGDKVMITPSAGITGIQSDVFQENTFSTFYRPDVQAQALGQYIGEQKHEKIGVIFQNDPYFIDFSKHIIAGLEEFGYSEKDFVIEFVNYGDDGRASALNLKKENVDAIVFGLYDEVAISALRAQLDTQFEGVALYANDLIEWNLFSDDYRGEYEGATYIINPSSPAKFAKKFSEKYDMEAIYAASNAYDTVYIIADMIENRGEQTYSDYLRSNTFNTTTFGEISFDELGGVVSEGKMFEIKQVVDGISVTLK